MRTELDVLNKNIAVNGCRFTRTALEFDNNDETTLLAAGACLQEMGSCGGWWWGDYLVAFAEYRLRQDGHGDVDVLAKDKLLAHYVRQHASVLNGKELEDTQIDRWQVARFYTQKERSPQLSNGHHLVAYRHCKGDKSVALGWLEDAKDNEWSVNELRAHIKRESRPELGAVEHVTVTQSELFAAKRWARATVKRVPDMEEGEMRQLLADLQPLLALATELAKRVGQDVPATVK